MNNCINKSAPEYRMLELMSGFKGNPSQMEVLDGYVEYYLDTTGEYPKPDQIPGFNSEKYINNKYDIKDSTVKQETLANNLHTTNPQEQGLILSKVYSDKLISVSPIDNEVSHVEIISRPSTIIPENYFPKDYDNVEVNVINGMLHDLAKYSGLQFECINTQQASQILDVPNAGLKKAFIKDGKVYVNDDIMTADSYIHEMLHIFIGSTKFSSPNLYSDLLNRTISTFEFNNMRKDFPERTEMDVAEEVLVTEFSKFLTGQESMFNNVPQKTLNKFIYDIKRALDVGIFGDISIKTLSNKELFGNKLVDVAKSVNSDLIRNNFMEVWSYSKYNRKLANMKESLLRNGTLKEYC